MKTSEFVGILAKLIDRWKALQTFSTAQGLADFERDCDVFLKMKVNSDDSRIGGATELKGEGK